MKIDNLKEGMLIRDMDRLLEVVKVDDEWAKAVVLLDGVYPPREQSTISYTPDGVFSFISSPTDKQLEMLQTLRKMDRDTAWADAVAAIRNLETAPKTPPPAPKPTWSDLQTKNLESLREELGVETPSADPDVLLVGDRVSWKRDNYRVYGLFYRQVRGYYICVSLGSKARVALRPGDVTKECG